MKYAVSHIGNALFGKAESVYHNGGNLILCVIDIYKTSVCPLAKVMRRELKARGIKKLKVVWSDEEPRKTSAPGDAHRRAVPASCSFVPPVAGYILAGEVIRDILGEN